MYINTFSSNFLQFLFEMQINGKKLVIVHENTRSRTRNTEFIEGENK